MGDALLVRSRIHLFAVNVKGGAAIIADGTPAHDLGWRLYLWDIPLIRLAVLHADPHALITLDTAHTKPLLIRPYPLAPILSLMFLHKPKPIGFVFFREEGRTPHTDGAQP